MESVSLEDAYGKWADELVGYAVTLVGAASAADLVAEVFARLLVADDGEWAAVREPRGYLFRCVLNAARMRGRSQARRMRRERSAWAAGVGSIADDLVPSDALLRDPQVLRAVSSLSLQQRAAIYHTYWEDLTVTEVAERLGTSDGTVKRQLARARAKLRKVLA